VRSVEAGPVIIVYYVDGDGLNSLGKSALEARERKEGGDSEHGPHLHDEINKVGTSVRKRLFGRGGQEGCQLVDVEVANWFCFSPRWEGDDMGEGSRCLLVLYIDVDVGFYTLHTTEFRLAVKRFRRDLSSWPVWPAL
jgi:hypothetical protein